jgi:hypothetical protein
MFFEKAMDVVHRLSTTKRQGTPRKSGTVAPL